jgi:serine/threonine protein kinase
MLFGPMFFFFCKQNLHVMHLPIGGLVAEGAFGRVNRAVRDGVMVAIKTMPTRRHWQREVDALKRIDHPSVLKLLDAHVEDKVVRLVTPLHSDDLLTVVQAEPPTERQAVAYARQMLEALEAVRAAGLQHLDVKLENFCTDGDRLVLIDFGSAEPLGSGWLTRLDRDVGTEEYLPPEVAIKNRFGETSDVWGVGVVLYAMQTGNLPYHVAPAGRHGRRAPDFSTICTRKLDASPTTHAAISAMLELDPLRRPNPAQALQLLD